MITRVEIGGRAFELAPMGLGQMRKASPFLDRIQVTAGALTTLEAATLVSRDMCEVLAIAIAKVDPHMTVDEIEDSFTMDDIGRLQNAFRDLCGASGLVPASGEVPAKSAPATEEALPTSSAESSASLSPQE